MTDIPAEDTTTNAPRLGFLGLGWIGQLRMKGLLERGGVEAAALADPSPEALELARTLAPGAKTYKDAEALLKTDLDGVVIATPNCLHASQTQEALEHGLAVFCQKPLGRTAAETRSVIEAAREADRLLAVDFSYRYTEGMQEVRRRIHEGTIGEVFAARLVFHNAYGPDKAWYYDPEQSGGGCVMDLGAHLIDLALWTLDVSAVSAVEARLFSAGMPFGGQSDEIEDYASIHLGLPTDTSVEIACSWNLPAGRDAIIEATFYGTEGSLSFHNLDGSFYDFAADHRRGTTSTRLCSPPDAWGSRALRRWAERLSTMPSFDPSIESAAVVAEVVDRIYRQATPNQQNRLATGANGKIVFRGR